MKTMLAAFAAIAALVLGGLGWATHAALKLEREQQRQKATSDHDERVRLALSRLDRRMAALLAPEDSRPFNHFSAIFAPPVALTNTVQLVPVGAVVEPSPLLSEKLPDWMLLHFQTDAEGWESPQVLSPMLSAHLGRAALKLDLANVTAERKALLATLAKALPPPRLFSTARCCTDQATTEKQVRLAELGEDRWQRTANGLLNWQEVQSRFGMQSKLAAEGRDKDVYAERNIALYSCLRNGEEWLNPKLGLDNVAPADGGRGGRNLSYAYRDQTENTSRAGNARFVSSTEVLVRMTPMAGVWLETPRGRDHLVVLRLVKVGSREVCQGVVLDAPKLTSLLAEEVEDLFPEATFEPIRGTMPAALPWSMAALPLTLATGGPPAPADPGWTALRIGLALAWVAALTALLAVGLGGWSLLDLSDRRIRFVSAVTHELRTPLTTLRLYLDLLLGGLVKDEAQQKEYIRTLHAETDRLTRLVSNVLDFSRLENQAPKLMLTRVEAPDLIRELVETWHVRCETAGKELIAEADCAATVVTDRCLLSQVLGNLLDNACKYTREAGDRRLWLRARTDNGRLLLEVEDRGPGIPTGERRSVFRAFRRGRETSATTGGVGLGLALARRWVRLLGGRLTLHAPVEGGVCFRIELPLGTASGPV